MKQLQPKTIIATGLPGSLFFNLIVAGLIFSNFEPSFDWRVATAAVALSVWLFVSIPTFVGMAIIRKRIGMKNDRIQKIRTAIKYVAACFAFGSLAIYIAYKTGDYTIRDLSLIHISEPTRPY